MLPVDPDLPADVPSAPPAGRRAAALVFAGGCAGGVVRYAATSAWPAPKVGFPWATFTVNTIGAFVLGIVVVLAATHGRPYLRLLVGTGFCGALTTLSAVVVAADRMVARHDAGLAVAYLAATVGAALLAAAAGLAVGRRINTCGVTGGGLIGRRAAGTVHGDRPESPGAGC